MAVGQLDKVQTGADVREDLAGFFHAAPHLSNGRDVQVMVLALESEIVRANAQHLVELVAIAVHIESRDHLRNGKPGVAVVNVHVKSLWVK